ncbi:MULTISPECIES: murein L,D-transpeptidase family protein [unclassified Nitratiruptor]|uniref:L,D-transpeptidase family protein n=1 Tax=unclassified Nitratiruptor TaxID=2624044 RepID=UPI00191611E1|nr:MULTISPECIES: L,D-transpeptidase family protein [unclassified Nitratiruptor]BCD59864.1 hypothetical protein NitYY0810_C0623 [Nitratiruptor sp. YY08-10]BCD63787.1 hypothetical protein NitYY0814_C0622 [Nitratiruptor sp. YY08-14]
MNIFIILFTTFSLLFAESFVNLSHAKIDDIEKFLKNLDPKSKIELEVLDLVRHGDKRSAAFLLSLLQTDSHTDDKQLENLLVHPKSFSVIVVSKNEQKLKLIYGKNGFIRTIEIPCITGKRQGDKLEAGDKKTPNGVYFPKWFIPQEKLNKIYGVGAFPLNYPNIIDKKIYHKTGDGIWLHATNDDKRKPFSSNGCVVVTNKNFTKIKPFVIPKKTPIVIVDDFSYVDKKNFENTKLSLGYFLYHWKKSWEQSVNGKYKDYIDCYSDHLISRYGDKKSFTEYKKQVAQGKKWIKLTLKNLYVTKDGRVLDYGHIYVASFDMDYRSNNYKWHGKKILYIIKENGKWKILAEENL